MHHQQMPEDDERILIKQSFTNSRIELVYNKTL